MASVLQQLRKMTSVVADTGDIEAVIKHQPDDATTNPSLLLKAVRLPQYKALLDASIEGHEDDVAAICDRFSVKVGGEILKVVKGYVSTEIDARLSFDTEATIEKARSIIALYEADGIEKGRILIKIASSWEGIQAAAVLEREGISCNMTLLFDFAQAQVCAEAGVTLISPFVGRIYDWYKRDRDVRHIDPSDDPGVQSVAEIFRYYKSNGYPTIIMGASFRTVGQIVALAGCDKLTISPDLLQELDESSETISRALDSEPRSDAKRREPMTEAGFRWAMNESAMATEKLADGIRTFAADQKALERIVSERVKTRSHR